MSARLSPLGAVFFDLDGTLIDPFEGITSSYRHALASMGRPVPEAGALAECIGPPLRRNFERLLGTSDRAEVERAVAFYRERFGARGWRENVVYPGIAPLLARLQARGFSLHVTTAKPASYATRIVEHHGLRPFFERVFGPDLDGALDDKARLVAHALEHTGLDPEATALVGDREHDVRAARANGLRAIGVTWGYGSHDELTSAGAASICRTPAELEGLLREAGPGPRTREPG